MIFRCVLALFSLAILAVLSEATIKETNLDKDQRQKLWQQVEDANQKSLPKTAVKVLGEIYESAIADEAWPEAVKALAKKYTTEGQINQPAAPFVIRKLNGEMEKFPAEIQPVMKVILANWFFYYYQQNRWQFIQRSQTKLAPSEDFETWDLARLLGEIDGLFKDALSNSGRLKEIPITEFSELLEKGNVSDAHRPTLFDFLAFQALDFYSLDEQIIRKQGAFDLRADSPIFSGLQDFAQWKIATDDESSFLLNAIRLYQDLIDFHKKDKDKTALIDANLHRLQFGLTVAVGDERESRCKAALRRIAEDNKTHPLSSQALSQLATLVHGEEDFVQALEIAEQGFNRFPESKGANLCFNLINRIKAPSINLTAERVWNDEVFVDLKYRNLEKVYFRLAKFDYSNWRWGELRSAENFRRDVLQEVNRKSVVKQWSAELPATNDYKEKTIQIPAESDVESGCYLLIASASPEFSNEKNFVSVAEVWVSKLAVVTRQIANERTVVGQVFEAKFGVPVADANVLVSAWVRDGRNSRSIDLPTTKTDKDGFFRVEGRQNGIHRVVINSKDQYFGYVDGNYKYFNRRRLQPFEQTIFLTDRSIYRPGQTISFKGICLSSDKQSSEYKTLPGKNVHVALRDVNNELIEDLILKTNDFGSFSGSVVAPRDRATGAMRLEVEGGPSGSTTIRVEEYKRPKFIVDVEKPKRGFELNDTVQIKGNAKSYTGAPIDSGKVVWRVVREVRYPDWWMWRCWWCPPVKSEPQEISNGEAKTEIDGTFQIKFKAEPDLSVEREAEPVFTYSVYVDVTDSSGETRSGQQRVRIGYASIQAKLDCEIWQQVDNNVELELKTSTMDDVGVAAEGIVKIFRLREPDEVQRAKLNDNRYESYGWPVDRSPDMSRIDSWDLGELVTNFDLKTDANGLSKKDVKLESGAYKAVFEANDKSGQKIRAEKPFLVVDPNAQKFEIKLPHYFVAKDWSVDVGETFTAFWGTGYNEGRAFIELEQRGKILKSFWSDSDSTQSVVKLGVDEKLRGGFTLRLTFVRDNRAYTLSRRVDVPWSNKKLAIKWEHFVSKLQPGGKETWTAVVSGPGAENAVAEMAATMYDASLDAYSRHSWPSALNNVFYSEYSGISLAFQNQAKYLRQVVSSVPVNYKDATITYRYFASDVAPYQAGRWNTFERSRRSRGFGGGGGFGGGVVSRGGRFQMSQMAKSAVAFDSLGETLGAVAESEVVDSLQPTAMAMEIPNSAASENGTDIDLSNVTARRNLNETAFFFPNLTVDNVGKVRIEFEVPEALTEWKILGFAHDNELKTALLADEAVTSKDLMVQPNPPRFLREGDELEFSVKVLNQSATRQSGKVQLSFSNAADESEMDERLGNVENEKVFDIPAGQSESFYWKLSVPDFVGVLTYKAVGGTTKLSDGEEGFLPVLSKRILVTESLPLPIRGNQSRDFTFDRLKLAETSDSLVSQSLTVQMASNPSWYAVMALPYLMNYPHQCSEQVFNRLYANSIGNHIVGSDPRIEKIFDQWRGTDALDSPLEKNEEIRNVLIAESPWLRDAKDESKSRRDVAILFDQNRLDAETRRALVQLKQMQYSDGSWPWFPGGKANDYITLYVTTGFGRLRHLGIDIDTSPAINSLDRLDNWIHEKHQWILEKGDPDANHLNSIICLYLYGRSFFLKDQAVETKYKIAVDYFLGQARKYWPAMRSRQSQGHLAIGLKRFGDLATPTEIMKSLTERSQLDDELGMYWQEDSPSWWWYRAPIETQSLLIEAYDEVLGDAVKVEECKIWLLKQKQTQNWKTTKATADAVYALLMRGMDQLTSTKLVDVKLGGERIQPEKVQAGTGFFEKRFVRGEIKPSMGQINVSKKDAGIAWGSVHWQYLEDVSKIEPYEGTPLQLKKGLFVKRNTDRGPVIEPVDGPVQVGDQLVTRVEIRVDRDMEYVHLKDYRGSGTEPVNVMSKYKYQDGFAYYESTKDTASHFFIDYLPRGTYVFEYSVRAQHKGRYESGIAELQCMYAPEFNSHSNSVTIEVE